MNNFGAVGVICYLSYLFCHNYVNDVDILLNKLACKYMEAQAPVMTTCVSKTDKQQSLTILMILWIRRRWQCGGGKHCAGHCVSEISSAR